MKALMAVAAFVPGMFLVQASGGTAVAVVDFHRAVAETPEGKTAISKLTTFGQEQQTAIEQKVKEATDLENRIRTQEGARSEAALTQMNRDLATARATIQTMEQDAQTRFDKMGDELLGPIQTKAATAIRSYAAERGYKIVLDASVLQEGLFYVHDTADITSEIVRRIASDLNSSDSKLAEKVPTFEERLIRRTWVRANFLSPSASQIEKDVN